MTYIFDGNSLFARGYFAANRPGAGALDEDSLSDAERGARGALWGLLGVCRALGTPDSVLFCWDGARKTDKGRDPKPQGYTDGLALFQAHLLALLPEAGQARPPEHESDDAVATAALREAASQEVTVISSDKDLQQVLRLNIAYYDLRTRAMVTVQEVCRRWGIHRVSHLPLYLAVVGDPADGIKGVPGYGPKKFASLYGGVGPGNDLAEALDLVSCRLSPENQSHLLSALVVTALQYDVPGIPLPGPFKPQPSRLVDESLQDVALAFGRLSAANEPALSAVDEG